MSNGKIGETVLILARFSTYGEQTVSVQKAVSNSIDFART